MTTDTETIEKYFGKDPTFKNKYTALAAAQRLNIFKDNPNEQEVLQKLLLNLANCDILSSWKRSFKDTEITKTIFNNILIKENTDKPHIVYVDFICTYKKKGNYNNIFPTVTEYSKEFKEPGILQTIYIPDYDEKMRRLILNKLMNVPSYNVDKYMYNYFDRNPDYLNIVNNLNFQPYMHNDTNEVYKYLQSSYQNELSNYIIGRGAYPPYMSQKDIWKLNRKLHNYNNGYYYNDYNNYNDYNDYNDQYNNDVSNYMY